MTTTKSQNETTAPDCAGSELMPLLDCAVKCVVPISGGKDSQACAKLAVERYGSDAVQGLFCDTQFEHPLTYAHIDRISDMYGIKIHKVCAGSVEIQIRKYKRFPGGGARFCTDELKIGPSKRFYNDFARGNGPFEVWYGMRSEESPARKKRYKDKVGEDIYPPHEVLAKYPKALEKLGVMFRLPIIDWTERDIFEYLDGEENPLYKDGFTRVGCFPCLAAGDKHKEKAFAFDDVGREHLQMARSLEPLVGRSVFSSKGGRDRNDKCDTFDGCAVCAI
jgi:3'-phosphoadenosine 5'-phosphosulfate sulfotransferase (PAPS reductase)/FAD synthetase